MNLGLLMLAAAASTASGQFDLICSGSQTSSSILGEETKPYSVRYRLDLERNLWCDGECKATHEFAAVLPTQIQFVNKKTDTYSENSTDFQYVDRETGAHSVIVTSSDPNNRRSIYNFKWSGQCEKQPFSGFPSFETKF